MTTHNMSCSTTKLIWYKKSIIRVIISLLLIETAVTLTQSPFQKANAQKSGGATTLPNRVLPGQEQQQQTTSSNPQL
jgi:hypothetical protein